MLNMAERLEDGEFWLPSQFLTDDEILMDMKSTNSVKGSKDLFGSEAEYGKPLFPLEAPYGYGSCFGGSSDLSSAVESAIGSPETESDEEDFLAGLTRQMAHSTLEDEFWRNDLSCLGAEKMGRKLSVSPQSTLCTVGSGCGCRQGSSRGSQNGPERVSSRPATWDLLYAAAGEVARMRMNEERGLGLNSHTREILCPSGKPPSLVSVPVKIPNNDLDLYVQQSLPFYQNLQASQFQRLRQQQMMKQQNSGVWGGQYSKGGTGLYQPQQPQQVVHNRGRNPAGSRLLGLPASAWPPLQHAQQQQHQIESGVRAMCLGNPGPKKECAGTGVFLPRRAGVPTETRKKSGCSTVLLPARVVQALNLNLEEIGPQPQFHYGLNGSLAPESDIALRLMGDTLLNHKRKLRPLPGMANEVRLPQEWTY